jgi:hypothetical protein
VWKRRSVPVIDNDQPDRAAIFTGLLDGIDNTSPDMLE